jgi:phosphatidylserine/phosphatidylglycerophosphate/cardiolipin synthase-like enzyme
MNHHKVRSMRSWFAVFRRVPKFQTWAMLFWSILGCCLATQACSLERSAETAQVDVAVRVVFSPQDDVAGQIVDAVRHSSRQVLVQAFSFTHDGIAQALIDAHRRGVEVKLIADREQTEKMDRGMVPRIAAAGVPTWLDGEHQSAHNKIMVIDAGTPTAVVITGSFNFTKAAQYKNAENVVFLSGNARLAEVYVANWQRHQAHSRPLTIH